MSDTAFDTLAAARKLKAARVEPEQAEAIADAIGAAVGGGSVATRADLRGAVAELKIDMLKIALGVAVGIVATNAALTLALFKLFGPAG